MIIYLLNAISSVIFIYMIVYTISFFRISNPISHYRTFVSVLIIITLSLVNTYGLIHLYNTLTLLTFTISFPICFYILYGKVKTSYIYITLISDTIITLLYSSVAMVFYNKNSIIAKAFIILIIRILFLLALTILNKLTRKTTICKGISVIPTYIYILIAANMFCFSSISYINNYTVEPSIKKIQTLNLLISISVIMNVIIILSLIVNVIMTKSTIDIVKILSSQIDLQISHYKKLDKLNSDIRKFRHNYINHLHSILSLIRMNEFYDAQMYIESLLEIEDTPMITYNTGNYLADAILADKSEKFGKNNCIIFNGIIPPSLIILLYAPFYLIH